MKTVRFPISLLMLLLLVACGNGAKQSVPTVPSATVPSAPTTENITTPTGYPTPVRRLTMPAYATPTLLPGGTVILRFFDAFNSGQVDAALKLLDETVRVSDCDFDHIQDLEFEGKSQVAAWLGQRIADHDHLFVSRLWGGALQPGVFGVDFSRRTSDTLRRLGFPNGIKNPGSAKVFISSAPMLITGIALGPGPASIPSQCRPEPYT